MYWIWSLACYCLARVRPNDIVGFPWPVGWTIPTPATDTFCISTWAEKFHRIKHPTLHMSPLELFKKSIQQKLSSVFGVKDPWTQWSHFFFLLAWKSSSLLSLFMLLKQMGFGTQSLFYHLQTVFIWRSYLTLLSLSFLSYEMGVINIFPRAAKVIKWVNVYQTLCTIPDTWWIPSL